MLGLRLFGVYYLLQFLHTGDKMGTLIVKSVVGLRNANKKFMNSKIAASKRIIRSLAKVNVIKSGAIIKAGLIPYPGGGALVSSIELQTISGFKVLVHAHDYGKGGEKSAEIEYGLKTREKRLYVEYPKLQGWVKDKWGWAPSKGIFVGGIRADGKSSSPAGIPHPKGLHYMELGILFSFREANKIVPQELRKIKVV